MSKTKKDAPYTVQVQNAAPANVKEHHNHDYWGAPIMRRRAVRDEKGNLVYETVEVKQNVREIVTDAEGFPVKGLDGKVIYRYRYITKQVRRQVFEVVEVERRPEHCDIDHVYKTGHHGNDNSINMCWRGLKKDRPYRCGCCEYRRAPASTPTARRTSFTNIKNLVNSNGFDIEDWDDWDTDRKVW